MPVECILVLKIDYWGNVVSDHKEELEGGGLYRYGMCYPHCIQTRMEPKAWILVHCFYLAFIPNHISSDAFCIQLPCCHKYVSSSLSVCLSLTVYLSLSFGVCHDSGTWSLSSNSQVPFC